MFNNDPFSKWLGIERLKDAPGTSILRLTVRNPAEPVTSTDTNGGFGLLGLRERAGVIGGELATRHENGDFVLELEVPVP